LIVNNYIWQQRSGEIEIVSTISFP
jgi:hypothetical protein